MTLALRSVVLASVSHYLLHHSPIPVLIMHAESGAADPFAEELSLGSPAERV